MTRFYVENGCKRSAGAGVVVGVVGLWCLADIRAGLVIEVVLLPELTLLVNRRTFFKVGVPLGSGRTRRLLTDPSNHVKERFASGTGAGVVDLDVSVVGLTTGHT